MIQLNRIDNSDSLDDFLLESTEGYLMSCKPHPQTGSDADILRRSGLL